MNYLKLKKTHRAWQELQPLSIKDRGRLICRYAVVFNYPSNNIEGNTLTCGQTESLLIEQGEKGYGL